MGLTVVARPDWAQDELVEDLEGALRAIAPEDEYLVHYEVIITTRGGEGMGKIKHRRLCTPDTDPALSLGLLDAMQARLRNQIVNGFA